MKNKHKLKFVGVRNVKRVLEYLTTLEYTKHISYSNVMHRFHFSYFIKKFDSNLNLHINSSTSIHNLTMLPITALPSNEKCSCFTLANFVLLLNIIVFRDESKFFLFLIKFDRKR